jgi:dienelactone hydrolase
MRRVVAVCLIALIMLATGHSPVSASEARKRDPSLDGPLNEQVIRIPGEDAPAVTLEVTIFHPDGAGPFPLAIMNHGATGISTDHRGQRYRLTNAAFYFLSRGYAVALPMMRGFSASGSDFYHFGCDLGATGIANAKDIRTVIRTLSTDPRFDTRQVVVAGQSFGGWNTLAVGTLNIPNVKGLINFNGGVEISDCDRGDSSLIDAAGSFGARTKIPSIWFYGDNDALFPTSTWRSMYDRYIKNGGHAELVDVGAFMWNSHQFLAYPESQPLWVPKVDQFLAQLGMPSKLVNTGYLPTPFPAATHFAMLSDVGAVPYLTDKARDVYRSFLEAPFPRAFVITEDGGAASDSGGFDPLGRALSICENGSTRCGVYAVDDHVVWTPFPAGPREQTYQIAIRAGQASTVDFAYRLNPDCSPRAFAKLREVAPPQHGHVEIGPKESFPRFPADSSFAVCNHVPVHGIAVTYSPAQNYKGPDAFSIVEDTAAGLETTLKMSLTVR